MQVTPVGKLQDITGASGKEKARRWAGLNNELASLHCIGRGLDDFLCRFDTYGKWRLDIVLV